MLHNSSNGNTQGSSKQSCSVLVVFCDSKLREWESEDRLRYPFPELASSSRFEVYAEFILPGDLDVVLWREKSDLLFLNALQVRTLRNPSFDEFGRTLESLKPSIVYLQGQPLPND